MVVARRKKPAIPPDLCKFHVKPQGGAAVVQIGRQVYLVTEGVGVDGERWWQFRRGETCWSVHTRGSETMWCSCPDQMFRRRVCKHRAAITALYGVQQVPEKAPTPGGWY